MRDKKFLICLVMLLSNYAAADSAFYSVDSYSDVLSLLNGKQVGVRRLTGRTIDTNTVSLSYYSTMSYSDWSTENSGQYDELEVAPIQQGVVNKVIPSEPSSELEVDVNDPVHVREFKSYINRRNFNVLTGEYSRESTAIEGSTEEAFLVKESNTHIIESIQSGVIQKNIDEVKSIFSEDGSLFDFFKAIDPDHGKYRVSYEVLSQSLNEQHVAHSEDKESEFLLSVLDLNTYDCSNFTTALSRANYSLPNNSIYNLGVLERVLEDDLLKVNIISGKTPDFGIRLRGIKSFHLIENASLTVLFYGINELSSRVVVLSNTSTDSDLLTGLKGRAIKGYLKDGFGALSASVLLGTADLLLGEEEDESFDDDFGIDDFIDDEVDSEIEQANLCDKGIGQGLKAYGAGLFDNLVNYIELK